MISTSFAQAADGFKKYGLGLRGGGAVPFGTPIVSDAGKAGPEFGLRFEYVKSSRVSWLMDYDHLRMEGTSNIIANAFNFGRLYTFETVRLKPAILLGVGLTNLQNIPSSDAQSTSLGTKIGASLAFPFGEHWKLSPEVAYHFVSQIDDGEHDVHAATFGVGLTYVFAYTAPPKGTKKKFVARAPEPAPEPELQTPEWETPPTHTEAAAPSDEDGDGVTDDSDRCPGTPSGAQVNIKGCEIIAKGETISIKLEVQFASNKDEVRTRYRGEVRKVAEFLENHPGTKALIEGHTDATGERAGNIELSQRRAAAVREYLIAEFGVESSRLTAKGFGPDRPIATNKTAAGRRQNRRVVATITDEK